MKLLRSEAAFREKEDLILVGAYLKGTDPAIDAAIQLREPVLGFLRQPPTEHSPFEKTGGRPRCHLVGRLDSAAVQKTA